MPVEFADTATTRAGIKPVTFPPESLSQIVRRWNGRWEITQESIVEMAHLIAASPVGQQSPGEVRKGEGGRAEVISGNRRLLGIEYLNNNLDLFRSLYPDTCRGPYPFKAIILDVNEREMVLLNLASNTDHKGLSPMDKAKALRDMENMGFSTDEMAGALRCSVSQLAVLRSYLTLDREAQDALHRNFESNGQEGITGQLATALVGVPAAQVREMVEKVESGEVKPSEATREVNRVKRASGQRVGMSLKEFKDELKDLAEDGRSTLAFDLVTVLEGHQSLRKVLDDWDPEKARGRVANK